LCELVGTKKIFTTSYHPQTNGFIERYNRTVSAAFRRNLLNEAKWDETLPLVTFQYNASPHSATWTTPFSAMFGSEPFEFDCGLGYDSDRAMSRPIWQLGYRRCTRSCYTKVFVAERSPRECTTERYAK
jgi:transposase InsO family protein